MEVNYHIPVLLNPSVDGLDIKEDGVYVDLTFGGGGHSMAAGCTIEANPQKARELILAVVDEVYS